MFNDDFEMLWAEFDTHFRAALLQRFREFGSLYRLQLASGEFNVVVGRAFYGALEETLSRDGLADRLSTALVEPLPPDADRVIDDMNEHGASPLQAFMRLVLFTLKHPLRAFFSGRDRALSLNTLVVRVDQDPSDRIPTGVSYGLQSLVLTECPYGARETELQRSGESDGTKHKSNHWFWDHDPKHDPPGGYIWIWHF